MASSIRATAVLLAVALAAADIYGADSPVAVNVADASDVQIEIPFAAHAPALDGTRDAVWDQAIRASLDRHISNSPPEDAIDLSGTASLLWDQEYLFVLYEIADDTLINDGPTGWQDDAVVLAIDGGNEKTPFGYDENDAFFEFGWGDSANQVGGNRIELSDDVEYLWQTVEESPGTAPGYRVEVRVPWSIFAVTPEHGTLIGLELIVDDDDQGGPTRDSRMSWYAEDLTWQWAHLFGTAMLVRDAPALDQLKLSVSDGAAHRQVLTLGLDPGATSGFDPSLDATAPPPPPPGAFDARTRTISDDFLTDYRAPDTVVTWQILARPATGAGAITFAWDPENLPPLGLFRLEDASGGALFSQPMHAVSRFDVPDTYDSDRFVVRMTRATTHRVGVSAGWNMVGSPVVAADARPSVLYPGASAGTLYDYAGGYRSQTEFVNGVGYWLRFPSADSVDVSGSALSEIDLALSAGWSMVSGPGCDVSTSAVIDPGGILVPGAWYAYDGGYRASTMLQPGRGYWVQASMAGNVTIGCGGSAAKHAITHARAGHSSRELDRIEISTPSGARQTLYLTPDPVVASPQYQLPPIPPVGVFDARFEGERYVAGDAVAGLELLIQHGSEAVALLLRSDAGNAYRVTHTSDATSETLRPGELLWFSGEGSSLRLLIESIERPGEPVLEQNHPNPFHRATTIRYRLPVETRVRLEVFDLLGRSIALLVDDRQSPGHHEATWDARTAPAGTYFIVLTTDAGRFSRAVLRVR